MGCDIHSFLEIKVNGHWVMISQAEGPRSYAVFQKMAGVRGDVDEAISPPKGLPEGMSEGTALNWKAGEGDWHTASWFGPDECQKLEDWIYSQSWLKGQWPEKWTGYLFGNSVGGFHEYRNDYPDFIEDVRVVFWFDN